jgi:hypothetical protein
MIGSALLGGLIGGALSAIPLLNLFNCCFCLLNVVGAIAGVALYLRGNPNEKISGGEAALSGAVSGALAGVIAGVGGLIINLMIGSMLASFYRSLPPDMMRLVAQLTARGVMGIPINLVTYGAFGALGGFLGLQLFYKDRMKA